MKRLTEGRKPVPRSLPPLAKAYADFPGFKKNDNRTELLFDLLIGLIQRCRSAKPQPFYAMRDIAKHFKVSLNTASRVYRRLDQEGVLTRVRSSQTMIAARTPRTRFAVRGVVCMPIWMPGFVQFLDWRKWFSQLQKELSRYRFVLEPVFYRPHEDDAPDFVDRILQFNPDYLLWNYPIWTDEIIIQSIADTGVSVLVIQNAADPISFTGRVYWQSSEQALQEGLLEWQASGEINRIIIPQHSPANLSADKAFIATLKACSLPHEFKTFRSTDELKSDFSSVKDFMRELTRSSRAGIIFRDELFYARLCAWVPEDMLKLFRRHRVMVTRQVFLPSLTVSDDITVDAVLLPAKQMARRIANDLNKGLGALSSQKIIFEAEWRPRTPLAEVTHRLVDE